MKSIASVISFILAAAVLCGCSSTSQDPSKNSSPSSSSASSAADDGVETIYDGTFSKGFNLYGPDSRFHAALTWAQWYFDDVSDPLWKLATWGCFVNYFSESTQTFLEDGVSYTYPARPLSVAETGTVSTISNATNTVSVDRADGKITLSQDTRAEYGVTPSYATAPRNSEPRKNGEAWPHLLIEQNIVSPYTLAEIDKAVFSLNYSVLKCDNYTTSYDESLHTAQFQWYVTLKCVNPSLNSYGKYIWFGIPLYDYRYKRTTTSAHLDGGKDDATGMLIYNIDSYDFLAEDLALGESYSVSVDLYEEIKNSFSEAKKRGLFTDCTLADMKMESTNIGWETTGTFDVSAAFSGISIKVSHT
jgi:hypothetical protein